MLQQCNVVSLRMRREWV